MRFPGATSLAWISLASWMMISGSSAIAEISAVNIAPKLDIQNDAMFAPEHVIKALNDGNETGAKQYFTESATIISDQFVERYVWHSFSQWRRSFERYKTDVHITGFHVALYPTVATGGSYRHQSTVYPAIVSFSVGGTQVTRKELFTFTTRRTSKGYLIDSWTWSDLGLDAFWEAIGSHPLDLQ